MVTIAGASGTVYGLTGPGLLPDGDGDTELGPVASVRWSPASAAHRPPFNPTSDAAGAGVSGLSGTATGGRGLRAPARVGRGGRVGATAALLIDAQSIALPPSVGSPDVQRHEGDGTTVLFATVLEATRCLDALGSRPAHPGCVMLAVDTGTVGAHADVLARGRDWLRTRPGEQVVSASLAPLVAPLLPRTLELAPLAGGDVGLGAGTGAGRQREAMYAVRPKNPRRTSGRTGMTWARRVVDGELDASPAFADAEVRVAHVHGQVAGAVHREVAQAVLAADADGRQVLFARGGTGDSEAGGAAARLAVVRQLCAGYAEALEEHTLRRRLGGDLAPLAVLLPQVARRVGLADSTADSTGTGWAGPGLSEFDAHLRALLAVVATAPTLLVVADVERIDSSSSVLLERVLAASPTTQLLSTSDTAHPLLEKRLRHRFGRDRFRAVAGDRLRVAPTPTLVARAG